MEDFEILARVKKELGELLAAEEHASKSWYKTGKADIPVVSDSRERRISPLSEYSSAIAGIRANNQTLLYSKPELVEEARKAIERALQR